MLHISAHPTQFPTAPALIASMWALWSSSAHSTHHLFSWMESSHVAQDGALVPPLRLGLQCHGHHLTACADHLHLVGRVGKGKLE